MPRKKNATHNQENVGAKLAINPNTAVKNSVKLNAVLLPRRSEPTQVVIFSYQDCAFVAAG